MYRNRYEKINYKYLKIALLLYALALIVFGVVISNMYAKTHDKFTIHSSGVCISRNGTKINTVYERIKNKFKSEKKKEFKITILCKQD